MYLPDYFNPVDFTGITKNYSGGEKNTIGRKIEESTKKLNPSNIAEYDIAIIGIPCDNGNFKGKNWSATDKIRSHLYCLAEPEQKINIVDFGNLKPAKSKKGTHLAIRDIIDYLNAADVATIIIGGSQDLTAGICEAFKETKFFTLTNIDAIPDIKKGIEKFDSSNYLTKIFKSMPNLFQFNLIGYQSHMISKKSLDKLPGIGDHIRLGRLRDNIMQAEPVLRNSNVISLDIGAVNYSNAPASKQKNPNGLRCEEICQLSKFAGMSNNLRVFGIFEYCPDDDHYDITARLSSEIIWYMIYGLINKPCNEKKIVYKVEISGMDRPMIFLQEPESNRWWFEISPVSGEKKIVACTENEYFKASGNEIPGRWLKFVQKMDGLSK